MKDKIMLHPDKRLLEINGVFYAEKNIKLKKIGKTTHVDTVTFEKIDLTKHKTRTEEIVQKIKGSINSDRVAEEVVKLMSTDEIHKIHKILFDKKNKAKIKRQDGCLGIEVSSGKKSAYINIFD